VSGNILEMVFVIFVFQLSVPPMNNAAFFDAVNIISISSNHATIA